MNAPINMGDFIAPKSSQLNSDDLVAGPRTITITRVSANPSEPTQPVAISFDGDEGRPWMPCKSSRRVLVHIWGADASKYVGRSLTLFRDPSVTFGGMAVGGIRIGAMSGIDSPVTMAITMSKAKRAPFTVKPLPTERAQVRPPATATPPAVASDPVDGEAQEAPSTPKQDPGQWADAYVSKVKACGDRGELVELQRKNGKALGKMDDAHPALAEYITLETSRQLASFDMDDAGEPA